jgi:hypothetical protein
VADSEDGRIAKMTRAGLAAAVGVAREQGLPGDDPEVLSSRGNVLVRLAPAPVVARVATLSAWTRREPFRWLASEVAVAGYAAAHDGPVVAPTPLADPGPHWSGGLAVSLWTWAPPAPPDRPEPRDVGAALARLHLAAAGFPGDLPDMAPLRDQISDGLAALEREQALERTVLAALRERHAEVLAELDGLTSPTLVLHGDAWAGNLIGSAAGWLWLDLEETCRGPREFDLAVMIRGLGADGGAAALTAYAEVTGAAPPAPEALAWFDRARVLEGAVWTAGMAHQFPARYRDKVPALLAEALGMAPPGSAPTASWPSSPVDD